MQTKNLSTIEDCNEKDNVKIIVTNGEIRVIHKYEKGIELLDKMTDCTGDNDIDSVMRAMKANKPAKGIDDEKRVTHKYEKDIELLDKMVDCNANNDIDSIMRAIKANDSAKEVIVSNSEVKIIHEDGNDEERCQLSPDVVACNGKDIDSILRAIKANNPAKEVIVSNGEVKTISKDENSEENTKLSPDVVAGYWYKDYPQIYQFELNSLYEQQQKMGRENFGFSQGITNDGKLYFVLSIRLKIDQVLPNYKIHKFLMVYGHNFNDELSGAFGGQALKVYPADPDETYYYRNGEIFHHLLPRDENNRHYICRSLTVDNARDINAYNSVEQILRWLLVFYIWKASGIDIDRS